MNYTEVEERLREMRRKREWYRRQKGLGFMDVERAFYEEYRHLYMRYKSLTAQMAKTAHPKT